MNQKSDPRTRNLAIASLVATALLFALLSIATRLLDRGMGHLTQVYMRVGLATLLACLVFAPKLDLVRKIPAIPGKDWIALLVMGTLGYSIAVYFITRGSIEAKLVNVSVIYSTLPFFVYLNSIVLFKAKLSARTVAILAAGLYGVAVVSAKSFVPALSGFGRGEIFVIASAVTSAAFFTARKVMSDHLNNQETTVMVMAIATVSTVILATVAREPLPALSAFSDPLILTGLAIGIIGNILANWFEMFAFRVLNEVYASQILLSETVFAVILGFFLYGETVLPVELAGSAIIVGSVYLANRELG